MEEQQLGCGEQLVTEHEDAIDQNVDLPPSAASVAPSACPLDQPTESLCASTAPSAAKFLKKSDLGISRLAVQFLSEMNLKKSADALQLETGCVSNNSVAETLANAINSGLYEQALLALNELKPIVQEKYADMRFSILEQLYLEHIAHERRLEAMKLLREQLTPMNHNAERCQELAGFMMQSNAWLREQLPKWRQALQERLLAELPAKCYLPNESMQKLMVEVLEAQTKACATHEMAWKFDASGMSVLRDHNCREHGLKLVEIQSLTENGRAVLFCQFSPDGLKLAIATANSTFAVFKVNTNTLKLTKLFTRVLQGTPIEFLAWGPESDRILLGGSTGEQRFGIFKATMGGRVFSRGTGFHCGAISFKNSKIFVGHPLGKVLSYNMRGRMQSMWRGLNVQQVAGIKESEEVLVLDDSNGIWKLKPQRLSKEAIELKGVSNESIMSFTINSAGTLLLLNNMRSLCLYSAGAGTLVNRFGAKQVLNQVTMGCFGGRNEMFVAHPNDRHGVDIFRIDRHAPELELTGHTALVNAVSWNPICAALLATGSDDGTVRIWAPIILLERGYEGVWPELPLFTPKV